GKEILVGEGSIILLWDGSNAGEFFLGKRGVLSSTMVKLNFKRDIFDSLFLFYLLKSKEDFLKGQTKGTGIPHVDKNVLNSLILPLPPRPEQQKIAEILSTVDKKVELEHARKEHLERIKRGLMHELLTGKRRVVVNT
ncbi:MAG: restriction endonuclease subunit S, partial [Methermicoccaceae archaeon]